MASPTPTTLDLVLASLQTRLVTVLEIPAERVVIDARNDPDAEEVVVQADQYVRIRVEQRSLDTHSVEARGRNYPDLNARISVVGRTRYDVDAVNSDQSILTDTSRGHLRLEHLLWDALLCFQPVDAQNNWLVREPVKPGAATAPRKPPKGWMSSTLEFNVVIILDLDRDYQ